MLLKTSLFLLLSIACVMDSLLASGLRTLEATPSTRALLAGDLLMLEDKTSALNFDEVRALPSSSFQAAGGKIPNYGLTSSAYWARVTLQNTADKPLSLILEHAYPLADFVDIYVQGPDGKAPQIFRLGDRRSTENYPIRYRTPVVPLNLAPGDTILHMRIQTAGANQWPIFLSNPESFQDRKALETGVLGLAFGAVYALLLYNLFLYLITRQALVGWYVLFLAAIGISYPAQQGLFTFALYGSDVSWWSNTGSLLFGGLSTVFGMIFAHRFLNLHPKQDRKTHWLFLSVAAIGLLTAVLAPVSYNAAAKWAALALMLTVVSIFACSVYRFWKGSKDAGFLALAWSAYIVCGLIYSLSISGVLKPNVFSSFALVFGVVFENIFLSLAVGYKLRRELREALQENQRINAALVDKEKARTLFFHNTSHELRTPLNGIIGFLDLVRRDHFGPVPELAKSKLDKSLKLAESLKLQVDTILDLAKSKRGELKLSSQLVSISELLQHANNLAEGLVLKNPLARYSGDLSKNEGSTLFYGDLEKLDTIVRNLLGNAFKFADPRRPNHVQLKIAHQPTQLRIEVQDQGIGIPPEAQQKIFEEFTQVQGDARRSYEGTGLGLSMVRDLVQLMKGTITVESQLGVGSTFVVCIPSASAADTGPVVETEQKLLPDRLTQDSPSQSRSVNFVSKSVAAPSSVASPSKGFVLLIDDNEINCEVISEILQARGLTVRYALSGRQGLELMRMARPQLVLLDMMMPEMSGEDVVQQMRAEESLRDIPVILLTARASEEDRLFGLSLGVDDYLAKPIVADELSFRVSNMLDRHELLRQVERLEGQDKLIQMGELFSDLSHELKNILHSGASVSDLQLHDARLALAGVSLGDAQREDLASALLKGEAPLDGLRRMESLDIPPQSPIKDALRSLRQILAFMNVSDQLLMRLWEDFQTMSEDELRYLENQLKILDQHQALMRMTRRTKELTHSVLAFSRTGSSDDSADISRIWLQVLQMAQARARRYTVRIDKDLDSHLVRANPSQLLQIVLNLTMNALDAIGERAPEDRWIRISSQVREGFVDIILTNGGPQIPASVRARLFERGFSTKGEKGTGIGLHVSQRLAAKMGGTLRCEGEGAHPCFVVSLPLAATQEAKRDIAA